ncbi:hypothetical protein SEA_STEPHIG9_61 [Mycobacterium phage Stephig9]|uniref:Uncharacterized protein n=1 Tax=Mycobacterium phage Stephig9 TaxID=2591224 RepID=A0A514DHB5_9CAUD|nr:hypothetical protein SEA_STEPHIG9_61 [Mycobacterium phage Stephig9]
MSVEVYQEPIEAELPGVTYSSNNSGGSWWLTDDDWFALERAGWVINWYRDDSLNGGRERFLGALASSAFLPNSTEDEAIQSFENVTGLYTDAQGCDCCGPPHYFYESWRPSV